MEIHLPGDLQRFLLDEIRAGRYATAEDLVRRAVERLRHEQESMGPSPTGPWLGSMREDADLLDEIVEEAMTIRQGRPGRLPPGGSGRRILTPLIKV